MLFTRPLLALEISLLFWFLESLLLWHFTPFFVYFFEGETCNSRALVSAAEKTVNRRLSTGFKIPGVDIGFLDFVKLLCQKYIHG